MKKSLMAETRLQPMAYQPTTSSQKMGETRVDRSPEPWHPGPTIRAERAGSTRPKFAADPKLANGTIGNPVVAKP